MSGSSAGATIDRRQVRPGRGRCRRRERGLRRSRPRRRRLGLRQLEPPDRRRGRPRRRRGGPHREGQRDRPARPGPARRPAAGPRHASRRPSRRTRSASRSRRRSATSSRPTRRPAASTASRSPRPATTPSARRKTFAATDGSWTEQTITHVGAGIEANAIEGDEHQRRSYPGRRRRRSTAPATSTSAGWTSRTAPAPLAEEAVALLSAAAVPVRPLHDHPRPDPALHADPRELRPPDRARPRLRHRGQLRRHELPDDRQARRGLPLRLRPRHIVADATAPGGLGTFGWDDEGVAAQAVPLVQDGIFVGYLSSPRDGAADRPPVRRRDAGRRLEPDPADPDDQRQPAAAPRHEPRRHRRRHRRRPLPRLEPLAGRSTTAA